jgi:hypothetical protein
VNSFTSITFFLAAGYRLLLGEFWASANLVHALEELAETIARQTVVHIQPSFLTFQHTSGTQEEQVLGNRGHIIADQFPQLPDTGFAGHQPLRNEESRGVRKSLEHSDSFTSGGVVGVHLVVWQNNQI